MSPTAIRLAVMMFLQFFLWGSWYVTAYGYLSHIDYSEFAKQWTYSLVPISAILSPLFVGIVADRYFNSEKVLGALHLVGAGMMFIAARMLQEDASPLAVNLAFFGHTLCYAPTLAISNSVALHNIGDADREFPLVRVFGTIGWILAGFLLSGLSWDGNPDENIAPSIHMFHLAAGAGLILGIYSFTLPKTPPPLAGQTVTVEQALGLDAFRMLKQPSYAIFMAASFLICIPLAFYYQFTFQFISDLKVNNPATKMTFGQISEILFMVLMPFFFVRLGVKWMLAVGMGCWVLRYGLFAAAAPGGEAAVGLVLAGIVLHGICYDFFFVTGQIYTDRVAPKTIRSSAQGMLVLFTQGIGMLIGAQLAGFVAGTYTVDDAKIWDKIWIVPCIMAAVVLVGFMLLFREGAEDEVVAADPEDDTVDGSMGTVPPGAPAPDAPPV